MGWSFFLFFFYVIFLGSFYKWTNIYSAFCFFLPLYQHNRAFFNSYIVKLLLSFFLFRPSSSSFRREVVLIPKVLLVNLVLVFTLPSWLPTRSKCTQSLVFQVALATVGRLMGKDCSVFLVPCFLMLLSFLIFDNSMISDTSIVSCSFILIT